jgi:hypothetical protein
MKATTGITLGKQGVSWCGTCFNRYFLYLCQIETNFCPSFVHIMAINLNTLCDNVNKTLNYHTNISFRHSVPKFRYHCYGAEKVDRSVNYEGGEEYFVAWDGV